MFNNNNKVSALKKKSGAAIKVVQNMLINLQDANKEVRFTKSKELEKKAKIEAEIAELETIEQRNEKFMNKINKLFED